MNLLKSIRCSYPHRIFLRQRTISYDLSLRIGKVIPPFGYHSFVFYHIACQNASGFLKDRANFCSSKVLFFQLLYRSDGLFPVMFRRCFLFIFDLLGVLQFLLSQQFVEKLLLLLRQDRILKKLRPVL